MTTEIRSAIDFYERHPISADIIKAKLLAARGNLTGISPDELFPHDQDHYGGLDANDALARRAQIGPGMRVADFCAGLGARRAISRIATAPTSPASSSRPRACAARRTSRRLPA